MRYWTISHNVGNASVLVLLPDIPDVMEVFEFEVKGEAYRFCGFAAFGSDVLPAGAVPARVVGRRMA